MTPGVMTRIMPEDSLQGRMLIRPGGDASAAGSAAEAMTNVMKAKARHHRTASTGGTPTPVARSLQRMEKTRDWSRAPKQLRFEVEMYCWSRWDSS